MLFFFYFYLTSCPSSIIPFPKPLSKPSFWSCELSNILFIRHHLSLLLPSSHLHKQLQVYIKDVLFSSWCSVITGICTLELSPDVNVVYIVSVLNLGSCYNATCLQNTCISLVLSQPLQKFFFTLEAELFEPLMTGNDEH